MTNRRVTIRDVARAAGVSTTTVSDAISGRGRLAAATRDRVVEIARELGYAANPRARNLRRGRTGAIGLYIPEHTIGLEYYMNLAIGAAEEALEHELALTLIPASRNPASTAPLYVDGVVVSDPVLGDPTLRRLTDLGLPVVTCERDLTPGARHAGRVESDHEAATRELLNHLAEAGARWIALLCPGDETSFGRDIRTAYETWCVTAGRRPIVAEVPFACQPEDIIRAVETLLRSPAPPDAILAVPDGGAAVALHAVLREGRRIPDDMLVASYVDSPALRGLAVPITAVDIAPREMGRRAARLVAELLAGEVPHGAVEVLPTKLVVRASTVRARR